MTMRDQVFERDALPPFFNHGGAKVELLERGTGRFDEHALDAIAPLAERSEPRRPCRGPENVNLPTCLKRYGWM